MLGKKPKVYDFDADPDGVLELSRRKKAALPKEKARPPSVAKILMVAIVFGAVAMVLWDRCVVPAFNNGSFDFRLHKPHQATAAKKKFDESKVRDGGRLPTGNYAG